MGERQERCFESRWDPEFSKCRKFHDDMTHVEMKKKYNADGDDLDLFFSDSEDNTPRCEIEVWRSFCRGMSLYNVERGTGAAGSDKLAWLDERTCGGDLKLEGLGDARCNPNFLTATGLYRALKTRRFNHGTLPDASRRLIYISDLNPASVHALAATASGHQAPVLRKAIYKHWAFKTSIAVKIRPAGFLSFHLDLQLPFFLLRKETPPDEESLGCEKLNTKPKRGWTDLSFLETSDTGISTSETEKQQEKEEEEVWGIREAHISFVVTGTDDWRWAGYGFIDAEIDGVLADSSPDDLLFDPIAARELKANLPIWKPREYWLKVFEVRIGQVRKEWDDLAHKLEHDIDTYMKKHPSALSQRSETARERAVELKAAFDWTLQAIALLRRLDGVLSTIVKAWKSFSEEEIGYFHGTEVAPVSLHARRSLHAVRATFRELQGHQEKLVKMNHTCSDYSRNLELRLYLESKEAADQNEVTSVLNVSVLYPIGLAAAIFSMQQEAIPFELTPRSFTLTVFSLIAMVHIVRIVGRYMLSRWPLLPKTVALWLKRERMDEVENDKEPSVLLPWFRIGVRPMPDVCLDRIQILGAEEGNLGTRALLGRPGELSPTLRFNACLVCLGTNTLAKKPKILM